MVPQSLMLLNKKQFEALLLKVFLDKKIFGTFNI